ncbi:MAG: NAD(P)H-hydrate dehydratase [Nitrososphaerota archaeon]|nr:NAD(P)H-hydrate dehydratase [Nitrososphaerota archaeon]MDG6978116.1 NAD(P)H-hydrate dehydratase [Nitrososphaerota archaeon]MDG7020336.1 NAD(P)H-hydrate dehydratase [Nitrososphaerota archaeon]MDG7021928.1 NAD(P)H-hydrate dehydratase [Nitrososphaerota archaeon]
MGARAGFRIEEGYVASRVPARKRDSHKGMNGTVCVVGGSMNYHGAPFLCAMGAARTGVDLVYLAVPKAVSGAVRSLSPDLIVYPLPDGKLTRGSSSRAAGWLPEVGSLAIGPGLGPQSTADLKAAVSSLAKKCRTFVVDADALRPAILESDPSLLGKAVVTPHAREFERLFGKALPDDLDGRVEAVRQAARDHGLVVLLKGPTDVVSDGDEVGLNDVHSPAMTVGGTGDVLTGVAAGLAAKGMGRFEAACCAAFINGLAGSAAAEELGLHVLASDVVARIPGAMKRFDRLE